MDSVMFIGLIVLTVLVIVGMPIGLSFLILWIIKKKSYDKRLKPIALVPILIIGYFIYTAFFPTDSFYKEDFKEVTGIDFPESGEIMYKSATYPDQFGDYGSTSIIKVDTGFYKELEGQLKVKWPDGNKDSLSFNLTEPLEKIDIKEIEKEFAVTTDDGIFYYIGFLSDKETLIIQRQSW